MGVLESGRSAGTLGFADPAHQAAQMIIAALEGAMLVARPYDDMAIFEAVAARLAIDFSPSAEAGHRKAEPTRRRPR